MSFLVKEGLSDFSHTLLTKPCQTYYKKVEAAEAASKINAYPLVVLHGGPLLGHDYCLPLQSLAAHPNISYVLFYDQVGCGKSTRYDDLPRWWDIQLAQLNALLKEQKLDLTGYHLFAHSMSTVMASIHAAKSPVGLRRLVMASAIVSADDVRAENLLLLKQFPPSVKKHVVEMEELALGIRSQCSTTVEQYLEAVREVRSKHFCRNPSPSQYWDLSMQNITEVMDLFAKIAGGKIMMLWDGQTIGTSSISFLSNIRVPTLVIQGEFDQTGPSCQKPLLETIPNVESVVLLNASHIMTEEVPELLRKTISEFIAK